MIMDRLGERSGAHVLFVLAMLVVVVFGLRMAAPILLPFALALFVAVVSLPIMVWLQDRGVPSLGAIAVTVLVDVSVFGLVILLASQSVTEFQAQLPRYVARLQALAEDGIAWLQVRGVPAGNYVGTEILDPSAVMGLVGGTVGRALAFVTTTFLVFLILIFILGEATVFPAKFRAILGRERGHSRRLTNIVREVQEYLGIKTLVSLATGIMLGCWAWFMELDFPILLGLIAFVLNYVPTIGSILASIPALLLALVLHGLAHTLVVGVGYAAVNTLIGNIIEPSLLGRRLGLSTLVVILSLLFWGWLWGPVGALLAVPLTMVLKIMLENTPDLRWIAVLLDKAPPPRRAVAMGGTAPLPDDEAAEPMPTGDDAPEVDGGAGGTGGTATETPVGSASVSEEPARDDRLAEG